MRKKVDFNLNFFSSVDVERARDETASYLTTPSVILSSGKSHRIKRHTLPIVDLHSRIWIQDSRGLFHLHWRFFCCCNGSKSTLARDHVGRNRLRLWLQQYWKINWKDTRDRAYRYTVGINKLIHTTSFKHYLWVECFMKSF